MNTKKFSDALSQIDNKYIDEAINYKKNKKITWIKLGAVAACFVIVVTAVSVLPNVTPDKPKNRFGLSDNSYAEKSLLCSYTEEELFTVFDTHIFKGKILSLDNI